MHEINTRTDIGGVRWSPAGLRDTLTVTCARILHHPAWTECVRNLRPPSTITFRLQNSTLRSATAFSDDVQGRGLQPGPLAAV
jgi:hypothetical protein